MYKESNAYSRHFKYAWINFVCIEIINDIYTATLSALL